MPGEREKMIEWEIEKNAKVFYERKSKVIEAGERN
jgi:hypothetical protein